MPEDCVEQAPSFDLQWIFYLELVIVMAFAYHDMPELASLLSVSEHQVQEVQSHCHEHLGQTTSVSLDECFLTGCVKGVQMLLSSLEIVEIRGF